MISLEIKDIRHFMRLLFTESAFDSCTLEEAVIKTYVTFSVEGRFEPSFFQGTDEEKPDRSPYVPWGLIRPACYALIRGKNTPLYMKLVLRTDPALCPDLPEAENISALLLMIRFDSTGLHLTTGTSQKTFSMSHDSEIYWDEFIQKRLLLQEIRFSPA